MEPKTPVHSPERGNTWADLILRMIVEANGKVSVLRVTYFLLLASVTIVGAVVVLLVFVRMLKDLITAVTH
jgi:hypothetical protein